MSRVLCRYQMAARLSCGRRRDGAACPPVLIVEWFSALGGMPNRHAYELGRPAERLHPDRSLLRISGGLPQGPPLAPTRVGAPA